MKKTVTFLFLLGGLLSSGKETTSGIRVDKSPSPVSFTENKGQVRDLNQLTRKDVLFGGKSGAMAFHLRNDGISYQLSKVTKYKTLKTPAHKNKKNHLPDRIAAERKIFRADVRWLNCNSSAEIAYDKQLDGVSNYYNRHSPDGIRNVRSFEGVWYKNIYNKTDLHYYGTAAGLKYDFVVHAGGDYKKIQMEINGCEKISLEKNGSVILQTPFGEIAEEAPIVFQDGKQLPSKWVLIGNVLSFEIENYDRNKDLIIDPITRLWGTYYGDIDVDIALSTATDASNNAIIAGGTEGATGTIIATSGSHMQTYGGGAFDAFVAKFNSTGVRQWATYYGDAGEEMGESCTIDGSGNVIMCGYTDGISGPAMSTSGSHQTTFGGGSYDAFVVKFNSAGTRLWGTYFGGSNDDDAMTCSADNSGNVGIGGYTDSNSGIASSGAHQTSMGGGSYDAYVAKLSATGTLVWGTYYGGSGDELIDGVDFNTGGDLYAAGGTDSQGSGVISTGSAYQTNIGGQEDGLLVKFNSTGARQWGTYFGGSSYDFIYSLSVDGSGNIFIVADTESNSGISSTGAHQSTYGGGTSDACLAKFDGTGARLWSTYYGGSAYDDSYSCSTDAAGNAYLAGTTESGSGNVITTIPSHQTVLSGTSDVYLVKFSGSGIRQWGTYYGGSGDEVGYCAADAAGDVYLGGYTDSFSGTVIATSGGHQPAGGGFADAFLAKFGGCTTPAAPSIVTTTLSGCANKSSTIVVNAPGTAWYSAATGGSAIAVSNTFVTGVLASGTYTYYAEAFDCAVNPNRTAVTITVAPSPTILAQSSTSLLCIGQTATLIATGAPSYTWAGIGSGNSVTVSPNTTTTYTVAGGIPGCTSTATVTQVVSTCTSLKDVKENNELMVYPNPTNGVIFITVSETTNVKVIDVMGREILAASLSPGQNKITLPEQSGIYFVLCQDKTFKVVKE